MANYGTYGAIEVNKYPKDGVLYTNLNSGNLFLSESDMLKTVRIGITNGNSVCLPDATQLNNKRQIIIVNTQSTSLTIRDISNNILTTIYPYETVMFWCTNISSSTGTWSITVLQKPYRDKITTILNNYSFATNASANSICQLEESKALVFFRGLNNYAYAVVATFNSLTGVTTFGTVVTVYSVATDYETVCALSATTAVVMYKGASNYIYTNVLTISGTTISVGAVNTQYSAGASYAHAMSTLNSSSAIISFSGNNVGYAQVITVSGTVITSGTLFTLNTGNYVGRKSISAINSVTAIVTYINAADNYGFCNVLSIIGTTISAGVTAVFKNAVTTYNSVCTMNSSKAVVFYHTGTVSYAKVLVVSGTTISTGSETSVYSSADSAYNCITKLDDATAVICFYGAAGYVYTKILLLSGADIINTNELVVYGSVSQDLGICPLSSKSVAYVYMGNAAYGYVSVATIV